jgi:hypothetical protein
LLYFLGMNLQQQPSPAPALPAHVAPSSMFTAAMPISQVAPGNGYHGPPTSTMEHGGMNLNTTTGFTMVGWLASSPPRRPWRTGLHLTSMSAWLPRSRRRCVYGGCHSFVAWSLTYLVGHCSCCPCVILSQTSWSVLRWGRRHGDGRRVHVRLAGTDRLWRGRSTSSSSALLLPEDIKGLLPHNKTKKM